MLAEDDVLDRVERIDGWLTRAEARVLYWLARNAAGPIVEIGSYRGRSTAALALGSKAGGERDVYAVDPFIGPQSGTRPTHSGKLSGECSCSPELLRANLDLAGVNGLVRIVPRKSENALADVPASIDLLFVDGAHDYESVCRDLDNYLPRVERGGFVVLHDVAETDMGVVRAARSRLLSHPNEWRVIDRVGSALVLRRVDTPRRVVNLMCPGRGFDWGPLTGIVQSSLGAHQVELDNNANGWDDFNFLWARALNKAEGGACELAGMLHSDVTPQAGWLDILADEMAEHDLDMISVACPLKDGKGVLSCGVGVEGNRWGAWRRLTVRELMTLPPTFGLDDLRMRGFCGEQHGDKILLHNTGCFLVDLRKPVFRQADAAGDLIAWFNFPTRVRREPRTGLWIANRESEDWFFSRQLHALGAKTRITRKVQLAHGHNPGCTNCEAWGEYDHGDRDTAALWEASAAP